MFAFIGILAVTLGMGWLALGAFFYGYLFVIGFAEGGPLLTFFCFAVSAAICLVWWFLVGTHIHVSIT